MSIANDVHIDIEPNLNNDHHPCREITTNDGMFHSSGDLEILPMMLMDGSHDEYLYYIDLDGSLVVTRTGHGFLSPVGQELQEEENGAREVNSLESYLNCGRDDVRTICRICLLDFEENLDKNQLGGNKIQLGCHCRGDLGVAHKHCAETWFRIKGNTICEICGARALNVVVERENGGRVTAGAESGTAYENFLENYQNCRWGRIVMMSTCLLVISALVISYIVRVNHEQ